MAKKKSILDLYKMKENGEKAVWIVLYDSCYASYAEEAGMDMILCETAIASSITARALSVVLPCALKPPIEAELCGRHQE